ncbi:MAG: uracil-DNA glycosylase [Pyrinomonadaceae bacterium]|nr:uracil-DNA glycosylase [Pyrinomonadaceae bacterium]
MSSTKQEQFSKLAETASACVVCPELADKTAVLSKLNGNLDPRVLFIAEAPGRQGADRTRKPFWGDKSGDNFQILLDSIGLAREEIFITNAVLCSPRKASGANRKPKKSEINNCTEFLKNTIEVINPAIVATLGIVALEALKAIEYHELKLKVDVAKLVDWKGKKLLPLYHPSPQVIASHRKISEQIEDYRVLEKAIKYGKG